MYRYSTEMWLQAFCFLPSASFEQLHIALETCRKALVAFTENERNAGISTRHECNAGQLVVALLSWQQLVTGIHITTDQTTTRAENQLVQFSDVRADFVSMEVHRYGHSVAITTLEFKVLKFFLLNPNRVITRNELLEQVWGYNCYPTTRTVDNLVLRLRRKLEPKPADPAHFRTVHGTGYKFTP